MLILPVKGIKSRKKASNIFPEKMNLLRPLWVENDQMEPPAGNWTRC
jgi:hypothetical protein